MPAAAAARKPRPASRPSAKRPRPRAVRGPRAAVAGRDGRPKMNIYRSNSARAVASNAAGMIPVAAGRAGVAVRELPDSSAIVRLTRGRLWIGLLGALLVGIVALNVLSLGLNASSGQLSQQINDLERDNSALRAEIAEKLSASKVETAATSLGLAAPMPEEISYLDYEPSDVTRAAKALSAPLVAAVIDTAGDEGLAEEGAAPVSSYEPEPAAATAPEPEVATEAPAPAASAPSSGGGVAAGL